MDDSRRITSPKNPRVLAVRALLDKRSARDDAARYVVEGAREISRALASAEQPVEVYFCADILSEEARAMLAAPALKDVGLVELAPQAYAKLAVRDGVDGLLVVFELRRKTLGDLSARLGNVARPLLVIAAQGIEKPGNLGALLRTADGAGADAVVTLDVAVDPFGPQVIRGSVGAVFHVPVVATTSAEFRSWCKARGVLTRGAALTAKAKAYNAVDWRQSSAIILGAEDVGLSADWLSGSDDLVTIPMAGVGDSLNVSVAGAVLLYEAIRQRR